MCRGEWSKEYVTHGRMVNLRKLEMMVDISAVVLVAISTLLIREESAGVPRPLPFWVEINE